MKFIGILLIVTCILFAHGEGHSVRITSNVPIPSDVMTTIYRSLREAPDNFSHREVQELIRERPSCVGDAFSILIPDFGSAFKRIAGFKIPLNQRLLVELLRTALAEDDTNEATIISCIFQSVRIAKSGKLKTLSLNIILKVLLLIAKSGQLPGIEKRIPFILSTVSKNNEITNDELLGVIRLASRIKGIGPILARIIEDLAGIVTGGDTFLRAFQDS